MHLIINKTTVYEGNNTCEFLLKTDDVEVPFSQKLLKQLLLLLFNFDTLAVTRC